MNRPIETVRIRSPTKLLLLSHREPHRPDGCLTGAHCLLEKCAPSCAPPHGIHYEGWESGNRILSPWRRSLHAPSVHDWIDGRSPRFIAVQSSKRALGNQALSFSCPFGATKGSKRRQGAANVVWFACAAVKGNAAAVGDRDGRVVVSRGARREGLRDPTCDYAFGRNFEPMKAASTNGALRIEDNTNVNGHNPPPARLRSTMVMTWLGTTTSVQIQSVR